MQISRKLPAIASIVAFVIAASVVLVGLLGPIVVIPFAIVPLCAGVGILRKRVWSAYGFAMFSFAQLLLIPIILLRPGSFSGGPLKIVANVAGSLAIGFLFLAAGRSLAASGAIRGRALPWIVAAALTTVPFFFVQTFSIPSGSMEDTLLPGDRILALMFPRSSRTRQNGALLVPTGSQLHSCKTGHRGPGRSPPNLAEGGDSEWNCARRKVRST